jgi:membrane associated rhomboid family serine protease
MRSSARWLAAAAIALAALPFLVPQWSPLLRFTPSHRLADPRALFTFAFTAASMRDTIVGAMVLATFGPDLERQLGQWLFLALFLTTAIGGAATGIITPSVPTGGVFAGAVGGLVVYAYLWPLNRVSVFGLTTVTARDALIFLVGYRLLFGFGFGRGGGIDATPFGGLAVGFVWMAVLRHTSGASQYRRRLRTALVGKEAWSDVDFDAIPRDGLHKMVLEELDRVREKYRMQGARSLNEEERAFVHRLRLRQTDEASPTTG